MVRSRVPAVAVLSLCLAGCVLGVGWLPDSSGFVFTAPDGRLVAYDIASREQRVILTDPAAKSTLQPAVSTDGKRVALAELETKQKQAFLKILITDLRGGSRVRSNVIRFAEFTGNDLRCSTHVFWSPDGRKLLVHSVGFANGGRGFRASAIFDVATQKCTIWPDEEPVYIRQSPLRPDGKGFLVFKHKPLGHAWVDWNGDHHSISGPMPDGTDSAESWNRSARWDRDTALISLDAQRLIIDTANRKRSVKPIPQVELDLGNEQIDDRITLESGTELLMLATPIPGRQLTAIRVVARSKADKKIREVVPPVADQLVRLMRAPDGRHALVRIQFGFRGAKGDSICVLDGTGRVRDTIHVVRRR